MPREGISGSKKVVKEGFPEKMTSEQGFDGGGGNCYDAIWEKKVPDTQNSKSKDLEAGPCLACSSTIEEETRWEKYWRQPGGLHRPLLGVGLVL